MQYAEFISGNHKVKFSCSNFGEETVSIDGVVQSKGYIFQNKNHIFTLNDEFFSLSTKYNILSDGLITITLTKNNDIIDVKSVPLDKTQRYIWLGVGAILILWIVNLLFN